MIAFLTHFTTCLLTSSLLREGGLIDDKLAVAQVGQIFTQVNASSGEAEDGDEAEAECVYEEYLEVLCRCCDARTSATDLDREPTTNS